MKKKKTNLNPIEERTLTLHFDSSEDMEQWVDWYGKGADIDANYAVDLERSAWQEKKILYLAGDPYRCTECKSANYLDVADTNEHNQKRLQYLLDNSKKLKKSVRKQYICEDCHHNYDVEEEDE